MAEELAALWDEAEHHLRAFEQLARRTVEEAWLAGDALLRIKEQLPHGAWTPDKFGGAGYFRSVRRIALSQLRQASTLKSSQIGTFSQRVRLP